MAVRRATTNLQVRRLPMQLHRALRRRADEKGVTMSEHVIGLLRSDLSRPTFDAWLAQVRAVVPSTPSLKPGSGAAAVRAGRAEGTR